MSSASFRIKSKDGIRWIESSALARLAGIVHAFSIRQEGKGERISRTFSLGHATAAGTASIERNRRRFFKALKAESFQLASLRQIHSASIYCVEGSRGLHFTLRGETPTGIPAGAEPSGDALLTKDREILLGIRTADCMPVLLADRQCRAVAAVHAGWRGTLEGIIKKAAIAMARNSGAKPENIVAIIGPSIRSCCYEVGADLAAAFSARFKNPAEFLATLSVHQTLRKSSSRSAASHHLDLVAVAMRQLQDAGLRRGNIHIAPYCTACQTDLFFSYRKEGARAGRMMAVIGIRS